MARLSDRILQAITRHKLEPITQQEIDEIADELQDILERIHEGPARQSFKFTKRRTGTKRYLKRKEGEERKQLKQKLKDLTHIARTHEMDKKAEKSIGRSIKATRQQIKNIDTEQQAQELKEAISKFQAKLHTNPKQVHKTVFQKGQTANNKVLKDTEGKLVNYSMNQKLSAP